MGHLSTGAWAELSFGSSIMLLNAHKETKWDWFILIHFCLVNRYGSASETQTTGFLWLCLPGFHPGVRQVNAGLCDWITEKQSQASQWLEPVQPPKGESSGLPSPPQGVSTTPKSVWISSARPWIPCWVQIYGGKGEQLTEKTFKVWDLRQTQALISRGVNCQSTSPVENTADLRCKQTLFLNIITNVGYIVSRSWLVVCVYLANVKP